MGISEREYAAMLASNPEIVVADDPGKVTFDYGQLMRVGDLGAGVAEQLEQATAPTEHQEQCALFEWAALAQGAHPELSMLFAVPNGGQRHPAVAAQLKAEGVKAGVPDVCLPVARGRFHALWVEMKRKPNRPTLEQTRWIEWLRHYGHCVCVCYGASEAQQAIMAYLEQSC